MENKDDNSSEENLDNKDKVSLEAREVQEQNVVSEISTILSELKKCQEQAEEYKDSYLRTRADFDNFRRRTMREKEELRKIAVGPLVEGLLPIIDNLKFGIEASLRHTDSEQNIIQGIQLVLSQMQALLSEHGVIELNPKGQPFNPKEHECIAHVPSNDVQENNIIEVSRFGYRMHELLLRPAYVIVSSGLKKELQNNNNQS